MKISIIFHTNCSQEIFMEADEEREKRFLAALAKSLPKNPGFKTGIFVDYFRPSDQIIKSTFLSLCHNDFNKPLS